MNSQETDDWQLMAERTKNILSRMSSLMSQFAAISDQYKPNLQPISFFSDSPDSISQHFPMQFSQASLPLAWEASASSSQQPTHTLSFQNFLELFPLDPVDQAPWFFSDVKSNLQSTPDTNLTQVVPNKIKLCLFNTADLLPPESEQMRDTELKVTMPTTNSPLEQQVYLPAKTNNLNHIFQSAPLFSEDTPQELSTKSADFQGSVGLGQVDLPEQRSNLAENPRVFDTIQFLQNDEPDEVEIPFKNSISIKSRFMETCQNLKVTKNLNIFDVPAPSYPDEPDRIEQVQGARGFSFSSKNPSPIQEKNQVVLKELELSTNNRSRLIPNEDDSEGDANLVLNPCIFDCALPFTNDSPDCLFTAEENETIFNQTAVIDDNEKLSTVHKQVLNNTSETFKPDFNIKEGMHPKPLLNFIFDKSSVLPEDKLILSEDSQICDKQSRMALCENENHELKTKSALILANDFQKDAEDQCETIILNQLESKISKPIRKALVQLPFKKQLCIIRIGQRSFTQASEQDNTDRDGSQFADSPHHIVNVRQNQWFKFPLKLLRDILPEPLDHQDYQKFSRKNNPDKSESHASLVKNPQLDNSKISPLQSDETDKITQEQITSLCKPFQKSQPDMISELVVQKSKLLIFQGSNYLQGAVSASGSLSNPSKIAIQLVAKNSVTPQIRMAQEEDLGSASTESRENNSREVKQEQSESKIVERIEQPVFDCGGTQADEVFRATSIEESGDTGSRSDLPQSELKRAIEYLKSDELDQVGGDAQWNTMARSYKIEQIEEGLNGSKRLQMVSNFGLDQGDEVPISVEEWKPVGLNQALKRSYEIGVTTALVMKDAVTALNKDNPSDISRLVHSVKQMTIHAAAIEGRVPISELIFQRVLAPGKKSAQTIGSIFPTSLFRCSLKVFKELPQEKEERVESKANLFERTLEQLSHDFPVRMDFPIAESIELTIQIPERKMQSVGKKAWKQLARSDVSSVASSLRSLERMRETRQKLGGFLVQMNKDTPQLADTMLNCAMKMIYQKPEDVCSVVQAKQRPNVRQLVVRIQSKTPQKVGSPQSRRKAYSPLTMTRVASLKQEFKIQTQSCYTKIWDRFQKGKSLGKGTFSDVYWALQWGEGGVIQEK